MDRYMYPISVVAQLVKKSETEIREVIVPVMREGIEYVDIFKLNQLIVNKQIKYNFSVINVEYQESCFCEKRNISQNGLNVIDLFCGAGGSSSGVRLAGFNLVGALVFNKATAKTHELNFPECKTIVGDITEVSPEKFDEMIEKRNVDIVIGSPPCQTFSSLSQGKIKSLGKDIKKDIRNYFYKYYLDYVSYYRPKVFLMENVPGFMTKYKGEIFEDFLRYVNENLPEYEVKYTVLDASDFSVPQARKKCLFVVFARDLNLSFQRVIMNFVRQATMFR